MLSGSNCDPSYYICPYEEHFRKTQKLCPSIRNPLQTVNLRGRSENFEDLEMGFRNVRYNIKHVRCTSTSNKVNIVEQEDVTGYF